MLEGGVGLQSWAKVGRERACAKVPPRERKVPGERVLSQSMAVRRGGSEGKESRGAETVVDAP